MARAAAHHGFDYVVCNKICNGGRSMAVTQPQYSIAVRSVVLLDYMAPLAKATRLRVALIYLMRQ